LLVNITEYSMYIMVLLGLAAGIPVVWRQREHLRLTGWPGIVGLAAGGGTLSAASGSGGNAPPWRQEKHGRKGQAAGRSDRPTRPEPRAKSGGGSANCAPGWEPQGWT